MSKYSVFISKEASDDLSNIRSYISNDLKNPNSAIEILIEIKDRILSLEEMPYRYNIVKDSRLAILGIRLVQVKNYLIFYIINEKEKIADIVRVMFNRRDWISIL